MSCEFFFDFYRKEEVWFLVESEGGGECGGGLRRRCEIVI